MMRWLAELAPRDRAAVAVAGVVLLATLVGAFVWLPLDERRDALARRVDAQARTLAWMQDAGRRVQAVRTGQVGKARDGRTLLALVDATVREAGLAAALRRAEPAGVEGVRVWLDGAPYGDVAAWLETLSGRHGLAITELGLDRVDDGRVNARLTLSESGGA